MKNTEVDFNGVYILLTIVRAGSFSAAARQLGVPANRLSRQIQHLEESLGIRLLHRTTRKLGLTSAGRAFLNRAEPAIKELELCWQEISTQAEEPRGHLRITTHIDFLSVVSIQFLAQFMQQYPAVSIEVVLSDDQLDLLETGIDVAFRAAPLHDEGVVARQLLSSRLLVVASPDFVETHGLPADVEALGDYPCLALQSSNGWTSWTLSNEERSVTVQVPARLTVNGMGALVSAAKAGLGVGLLPDHLIAAELMNGNLINLLPHYHHQSGGIYIVYPSRKHPSAALRQFIEFVMSVAESTPVELLNPNQ